MIKMTQYWHKTLLVVMLLSGMLSYAYAQEGNKAKEQEHSEPIELPKFIIKGTYQADLRSGSKQFPAKPNLLTPAELDSVNSLEKQQSLVLPVEGLPEHFMDLKYRNGFVKGSFGRFTTPNIEVGYGKKYEGYELFGNAGFEMSQGDVENSEYSKIFADFSSDYIAPEKFWIFGGSRTRTFLNIFNRNYKLYATDDPVSRNAFDMNVGVDVNGNTDGYQFNAGAGFHTHSLTSKPGDATDNSIYGKLGIQKFMGSYFAGANMNMDLHSFRGTSVNFIQIDGFGSISLDKLMFKFNAGYQLAASSDDNSRSGLLLSGDIEYRLNKNFTIKAGVESGLDKISFRDFSMQNPYIDINSNIDYPYNIALLKTFIYYHPNEYFGTSAGVKLRMMDRMPMFVGYVESDTSAQKGTFKLAYEKAQQMEIILEGFWKPDELNYLTYKLIASMTDIEGDKKSIPYYAPIIAKVNYRRAITRNFGTNFGLNYVGERNTDLVGKEKIDGYFNLSFGADYRINNDFSVFLNFDNLTNSNIFIWNKYKERGLFASLGVKWLF